ncbi:hypothetical protein LCGC14_2037060, partial [marine sediment metagenome]
LWLRTKELNVGDQNERCTCKFQGRHVGWQQLLAMAKNEDDPMYSRERVSRIEQLEPKHRPDCNLEATNE